jgi:type II secretory ATPase GspE/PulE/Tfp pilus assembly ATPase PilB-like protein
MTHARQIQVQQKRGINFVNGLRSILRQDPDVIMVGEIRDHETVVIATSAALTGHLVLSTLHTNDAISTITRCVEMGIEPYLVAATLCLVVSQRLVRKLCLECRCAVGMNPTERAVAEKYGFSGLLADMPNLVYVAKGCEKCNGTGYSGRTVVAEILSITEQLKRAIIEKQSLDTSAPLVMETIGHQAVAKYLQGVTSFEEMIKILHE